MLRVVLAQLNFIVGDITGNTQKMIAAIHQAIDEFKSHLIIFPELALSGYPPEDLLFRPHFYEAIHQALEEIKADSEAIDILLGYPEYTPDGIFNSAIWFHHQTILCHYRKQKLPNYSVFDEKRYFKSGRTTQIAEIQGLKCAPLICEDIWYAEPAQRAKEAGAQLIFCLNASPYSIGKVSIRQQVLKQRVHECGLPIFYINTVGGQDELVFEGDTQVIDHAGILCAHAGYFQEKLLMIEIDEQGHIRRQLLPPNPSKAQSVYEALKLGIRDYVNKNHFPGVIVGTSGGIDSALTLTLATDALGANRVTAVRMPSQYTSSMSLEDAAHLIEKLQVNSMTLPIQSIVDTFCSTLKDVLTPSTETSIAEQNIQARVRGTLLMAISNQTGNIVLSTGNKSEMSVGYATLYGDMVGGFAALKDVYKTLVYEVAHYRNSLSPVIPDRIFERPPTPELKFNQLDTDDLPPYPTLDSILNQLIEEEKSPDYIIQQGFDADTVHKVAHKLFRNEYKRRQAPVGIRITEKAFGRDRRYPITSGYLMASERER